MFQLQENEVLEPFFQEHSIIQNTALYRFTSDSILLSQFARFKAGDKVADFCAGSGVVGLHFLCLHPKCQSVTLFELQPALADMARRTVAGNGFENVCVENMPLQEIPKSYDDQFSLILCNPPYEKAGFDNMVYEKAICRKEITITLKEIVDAAYRKLKFGGRFAIIHRADRSVELIYELKKRGIEPKYVQYVAGKEQDAPYLVMVEGVKGGKEGVKILPVAINRS